MASSINASTTAGVVTTADTSGVLNIQTAGTTAVTVDASQNVGIGTSSPAQTLHVKTSTSATPITLGVLSNATGLPALSLNGAYASTTMAGIYANGATSTSLYYMIPSGQNHFFGIADVTKMTLNSDGNIKLSNNISVGGATPTTSGTGITFPATQNASANANTLDDYEEGTWTPNQGSGLTVVGTFSSSGSYTKIGRVVTIIATVQSTTSISTSGFGTVCSNLPFSSVAGGSAYGTGTAYNNSATATSVTQAVGLELATFSSFAATTAIHFTNVYTSAT